MKPLLHAAIAMMLLRTARAVSKTPLRICAMNEPGFDMPIDGVDAASITSDDSLRGYSVDVRRELLANRLDTAYTVRLVDSWAQMQVLTRTGECDIAWAANYVYGSRESCTAACAPESEIAAAITAAADLTPYRCCLDFSVQYLPWSLSILTVGGQPKGFLESLASVVTRTFFVNFVSFFFLVMVVFGHLVWFVERGANPNQFPPNYADGVDDGVWWAVVTASTVGYGDLVPITPAGRLLTIVYTLIGLSLFSILSGFIASEFVALRSDPGGAESTGDLAGSTVCGYSSVFSSSLFEGIGLATVSGETMDHCGSLLERGEVDAIVWDTPTMLYWRAQSPWAMSQTLPVSAPLSSILVGLAVREGGFHNDPRLAALHVELIDFRMSDAFVRLQRKWFPKTTADDVGADEPPDWPIIGSAVGLASVYALAQLVRTTRTWLRKRRTHQVSPPAAHERTGVHVPALDVVPADPPPSPPASSMLVDDEPFAGRLSHLEEKLVACLREEMQLERRSRARGL